MSSPKTIISLGGRGGATPGADGEDGQSIGGGAGGRGGKGGAWTYVDQKLGPLTAENFREIAQRAIATYEAQDLIFEASLWSRIIGLYNEALDKAQADATVRSRKP